MLSASHKSMYSMSCEPTVRRTVRKGIQHAIRGYMHTHTHAESCMQHETYALPCTAAWHCTVSMGASSTAPHEKRTHAHPRHGMCLQMRPHRAASTRRAGLRQLLVLLEAHSRQQGRRETPDRCFSTPPLTRKGCRRAAAAAVRCPNGCIPFEKPARSGSAPLLATRFYKFQILFSGSALLAARS